MVLLRQILTSRVLQIFFNEYGRTKYLAEQVYRLWYEEDPENRTLVIVRPTVIFGEGNRGNVYNLLSQVAKRRFVMFGAGKNKKSMAYVENVAAFLQHSFGFDRGLHVYNYIDKPDFDMNGLVKTARITLFGKGDVGLRVPAVVGLFLGGVADVCARVLNRNLPISSIRVKKFMGTTQFSSSIAETGFTAPVSLEEGLISTLRYEFEGDRQSYSTPTE